MPKESDLLIAPKTARRHDDNLRARSQPGRPEKGRVTRLQGGTALSTSDSNGRAQARTLKCQGVD